MKTAGMRVGYRHAVGDVVWVQIGGKPRFKTKILERAEGRPFYRVDWIPGGFDPMLNSVAVCEAALLADDGGIAEQANSCAS